jgi:hypothetical protein
MSVNIVVVKVASGDDQLNSDVDEDDDDDSISGPNSMLSQSLRSNNNVYPPGVNQDRYFRYKDQVENQVYCQG